MVTSISDLHNCFAFRAAAPLVVIGDGEELLGCSIASTIALMPFLLAVRTSGVFALWTSSEVSTDEVWQYEFRALRHVTVRFVFRLELLFPLPEFRHELSG